MYPPQMGVSQQSMMSPVVGGGAQAPEMCQIGVPNAAVGAIIGTAGSNIKQIMRDSGAFVNVSYYTGSIFKPLVNKVILDLFSSPLLM